MYNKKREASCAAADFLEAQLFCYVLFEATHKISKTPAHNAQLQKSRLMHRWMLQQHHPIPCWGLVNIYKVLIVPNGHEFIICQVIMSTKSVQDHISPLFISVDQSSEGDVVIIYDISMEEDTEALLSHFDIYLTVVFGSVVSEAFTVAYRTSMGAFQYCQVKRCAVEIDASTIASDNSFKCNFTIEDSLMIR